jgi:hypothetical protein
LVPSTDVSEIYDKCFQDNLTLTKNCILKKSLAYFPMTSRVTLTSNHMDAMRSGISTKGQVISIGNSIDPSNFKEIGTKNYWINNSTDIWNSLTVLLGLKLEVGFTPFKLALLKLYKNSLLAKFLRRFEIEIMDTNIRIKTFYQLEFMNILVNLEKSSLNKVDYIIIKFLTMESP